MKNYVEVEQKQLTPCLRDVVLDLDLAHILAAVAILCAIRVSRSLCRHKITHNSISVIDKTKWRPMDLISIAPPPQESSKHNIYWAI
jgi:hypothetical protein